MGYAVIGYFDKNTDARIKALWRGMADIQVCNYLSTSANNPHIKFAMFDSLDLNAAENSICALAAKVRSVNLHFKSYGFYPNANPFVTLDIAVSLPVLQLHGEIKETFSGLGTADNRGFFDAGIWKPDCQLTIGIDKSNLAKAINYLSETQLPFDGKLEKIGVIAFYPAKQLFSYLLS